MGVMTEAFKELFKKPFTERYPKEQKKFYPRYRGRVQWRSDKCIRCLKCVKACPNFALKLNDNNIVCDDAYCICCGMCQEVCPVEGKAIWLSQELPRTHKR